MPCYLDEIMMEINRLYKKSQSYSDAENLLYEFAIFINRKDTDATFCGPIFTPIESEKTHWCNWLKRVKNHFKKEIPDITLLNIVNIMKRPKDINVACEIISLTPLDLLKEFKEYLEKCN